jgi:hypothetical protein
MAAIGVEAQLADAAETCRVALQRAPLAEVLPRLASLGQSDQAFQFLSRITVRPESGAELGRLCASVPSDLGPHGVERALLILASQYAAARVPGLPVSDSVKRLFADEFRFFADPPAIWAGHFHSEDVRYHEMARIATLRRFPAGQFHWEVSGFPRSWVLEARQPWRLLVHVLGRMGGFSPVFEMHVNARRKNRLILVEKEANISYCRAARALEKQPDVRGLMLASWLFCESTSQVTPRLAWLRRTPQSAGAIIADLGPAPPDSGFLTGSDERRKLYEEGVYRPKIACVLWPRKAVIDWVNEHPEFDS